MNPHSDKKREARFASLTTAIASLMVLSCATKAQADAPAALAPVTRMAELAPNLVPNFEKVSDGIWRGSAPSSRALDALKHDGVKTIVDLRMDGQGVDQESQHAKELGVNYYHFALGFNKPEDEKLSEILAVMTNPVNQPVFVHCRQGADRTGMLVALYRRRWQGWTFEQAYVEMRRHHFKPFLFSFKHEVANATAQQLVALPQSATPPSQSAPPEHKDSDHLLVSQRAVHIN
jgi:tyrosine-protein phosphatase SIW14